jgi:hypothetical protein
MSAEYQISVNATFQAGELSFVNKGLTEIAKIINFPQL